MIEYKGLKYTVNPGLHNRTVHGYLVDGSPCWEKPRGKKRLGYIVVDGDVIEVYRSRFTFLIPLICVAVIIAGALMYDNTVVEEYRVSFAEYPLYDGVTLYCNVVNVADIPVEVSFTDGTSYTTITILQPGDTLPLLEVDFTPTHIVYGNQYTFPLEVRND